MMNNDKTNLWQGVYNLLDEFIEIPISWQDFEQYFNGKFTKLLNTDLVTMGDLSMICILNKKVPEIPQSISASKIKKNKRGKNLQNTI